MTPPARRMNDSDALLWKMGHDPALRSPVVAVVVLDSIPRWEELRSRVARLTQAVPAFRSKVTTGSLVGLRPRWTVHDTFDLDVHLRRVAAAPPATLRSVLDIAQVMGTTAFDPELPLWEAVVVEGLAEGGSAVVIKLHHAIVDGLGGLSLLAGLFDADAESAVPVIEGPTVSAIPTESVSRHEWATAAVRRIAQVSWDAVRAPIAQTRRATTLATSVVRLLAPAPRPFSPLMTDRGIGRRFEVLDLSADLLHEASLRAGCTMNDLFVTAVLEGVHLYHQKHGVDTEQLRVLVPVSTRTEADEAGSNRFVPVRLPIVLAHHPIEQLDVVHRIAGTWKSSPALKISPVVAVGLNFLPSGLTAALWGSMLKGDDVVATNVTGPVGETHLAGARIDRLYAFAPTIGAALNAALVTTHHQACIGVNVDTTAIPDGDILVDCLTTALRELLELTGAVREVS